MHGHLWASGRMEQYLTMMLSAPRGVTRIAGAKAYAAKFAISPTIIISMPDHHSGSVRYEKPPLPVGRFLHEHVSLEIQVRDHGQHQWVKSISLAETCCTSKLILLGIRSPWQVLLIAHVS